MSGERPGVENGAAVFVRDDLSGVGRFRTFGPDGPLYEVVGIAGDRARVRVVLTGEQADYPTAAAISDPLG